MRVPSAIYKDLCALAGWMQTKGEAEGRVSITDALTAASLFTKTQVQQDLGAVTLHTLHTLLQDFRHDLPVTKLQNGSSPLNNPRINSSPEIQEIPESKTPKKENPLKGVKERAPSAWAKPEWWAKLEACKGYVEKNYSGSVETFRRKCEAAVIPPASLASYFADEWPYLSERYGRTNPVRFLLDNIRIQIDKYQQHQAKGGTNGNGKFAGHPATQAQNYDLGVPAESKRT